MNTASRRPSDRAQARRPPTPCRAHGTAGNVVFGSAAQGLGAYNATTGAPLWNSRIGGVTNGPITYELDGKQYVVAAAGSRFVAFVLNE